jgi:hypothetical protein
MQGLSQQKGRKSASLLIYTAWNLWKERNRHFFKEGFISRSGAQLDQAGDKV